MKTIEKLRRINYVPVVSAVFMDSLVKDVYRYHDKQLTAFTEDAFVRYDRFLVNPFHCAKAFAERRGKIREDVIIFSDSGGLQELTLKKTNQSPEDVVLWQEKHTHIGFSFDSIPFAARLNTEGRAGINSWKFDASGFMRHAEKSTDNLRRANKVRSNPDFMLYAIIQGRTYEEYEQWYSVLKSEKTEGYCVKCPNHDPINMADLCLFSYFNLNTPIHFLGVENMSRSIVCCYLTKYFKHAVSFDGSSWAGGSRFRSYKLPFSYGQGIRILRADEEAIALKDTEEESLDVIKDLKSIQFCACPACSQLDDEDFRDMVKTNDRRLGVILSFHNMYQHVLMLRFVDSIIDNGTMMRRLARNLFTPSLAEKVTTAFDFIDYGVENGYELAKEKYKFQLAPNEEAVEQTSIFNF